MSPTPIPMMPSRFNQPLISPMNPVCWLVIALFCPLVAPAADRLPTIFTDHLVLQRDRPVAIWGEADEGETVTVEFAGKRVETRAKDGRWRVKLAPLSASEEPRTLVIQGENRIDLRDGKSWSEPETGPIDSDHWNIPVTSTVSGAQIPGRPVRAIRFQAKFGKNPALLALQRLEIYSKP